MVRGAGLLIWAQYATSQFSILFTEEEESACLTELKALRDVLEAMETSFLRIVTWAQSLPQSRIQLTALNINYCSVRITTRVTPDKVGRRVQRFFGKQKRPVCEGIHLWIKRKHQSYNSAVRCPLFLTLGCPLFPTRTSSASFRLQSVSINIQGAWAKRNDCGPLFPHLLMRVAPHCI